MPKNTDLNDHINWLDDAITKEHIKYYVYSDF